MPELPDITVYAEALEARATGHALKGVRLSSPFLLRSVEPPLSAFTGRVCQRVSRLGKRLVFHFDGGLALVLHLMIAGRLQWKPGTAKPPGKIALAAFEFDSGTLILTEAGTKKRASLHAVANAAALAALDRGGLEPLTATLAEFAAALTTRNHTLKRALTDPRIFSGIGNAYSDEILHAARLSPFKQTQALDATETARLYEATQSVLRAWTDKLRAEAQGEFPTGVTAFRADMAVHGRYRQPCPVCGAPVQRIVYAENEANYCAPCQTSGKLLADRALSRLLKADWPKTMEELEQRLPERAKPLPAKPGRPRRGVRTNRPPRTSS